MSEEQKRLEILLDEKGDQKMDDFLKFVGSGAHSLDDRIMTYYITELAKLEVASEMLAKNQEVIKKAILVLVDRIDPMLSPQILN